MHSVPVGLDTFVNVRSIPSKLLPLQRTRARISIFRPLTSTLPLIVSCMRMFDMVHNMLVLICCPRSGASLTLAYGRRYGLIGRNGRCHHW